MLSKYINDTKKKIVATTLAVTLTFSSSIAVISSFKANADPTLQAELEIELKEAQAALEDIMNKPDFDYIEYYNAKTNLESIKSKLDTTKDVQSDLNIADAETDNYTWDNYEKAWDEYEDAETKYEAAKTEYKAAKAKLKTAEIEYEAALNRSEIDYQEYAITKTNLETAKSEYEDAETKLETAKTEYKAADDKLCTAEEEYEDSLTSGAEEDDDEVAKAELAAAATELAETAAAGDEYGMKLALAKVNETNTEIQLANSAEDLIDAITSGDENAISAAVSNVNEAAKAEDEADIALDKVVESNTDIAEAAAYETKQSDEKEAQAKTILEQIEEKQLQAEEKGGFSDEAIAIWNEVDSLWDDFNKLKSSSSLSESLIYKADVLYDKYIDSYIM